MKIYAMTQKGTDKLENEDRILVNQEVLSTGSKILEMDFGIFAIADGVGGNKGGEVASQFLTESMIARTTVTNEWFQDLNHVLIAEGESQNLPTMASTLAGISIEKEEISLFSVGNSRVYAIQNGKYLKQLTVDDSVVQQLLVRGQLKECEVPDFQRKHEITACFGGGKADLCKIKLETLEKIPSIFLITSDGIHDHVSVDDLEELIINHGFTLELCEKIIDLSITKGSNDDLSILIGVN